MCSEKNHLKSISEEKDELSESSSSFYSMESALQDQEILNYNQHVEHGFISIRESKERILICNIGFNICLQLITFFLVMLHVTYNNAIPVTIPNESREEGRIINSLKIYNTLHKSAIELLMLKNFTFLFHERQNYTDNDLSHYFFSEVKGQYYKVTRRSDKKIFIQKNFGSSEPIKNSSPVITFSPQSLGVRIGKHFWILGGEEENISLNTQPSRYMSIQRKSLLWNVKKSKWTNGPTLPTSIFLIHASATAINSTHVVFVGANYFNEDGPVSQEYTKYMQFINPHSHDSIGSPYLWFQTVLYDFESKKWRFLAQIPGMDCIICLNMIPISTVTFFGKSGKISVLTSINFDYADQIRIYSMDFTNFVNQWNTFNTNIETNPGKLVVFNGILMFLSFKLENASIGYYYDPNLHKFSPIQVTIPNGTLNSNATFPQTHSDLANAYQSRMHAFSGYKYT